MPYWFSCQQSLRDTLFRAFSREIRLVQQQQEDCFETLTLITHRIPPTRTLRSFLWILNTRRFATTRDTTGSWIPFTSIASFVDSPLLDVPDVVTERRDIVPTSSSVRVLVETGREDSTCLFEDTVKCSKLNFDVLGKFNFLFFLITSYFYCC